MNTRAIEIFYNTYKNSLRTITRLENRLLEEAGSYDRWFVILKEKSRTLRDLYVQNEELYDLCVGDLVRHPKDLTQELAEMYLTHVDFFLSEGYRDYGVMIPVLENITPYYETHGPKARLFDCYFFTGLCIFEYRQYQEAFAWFDKAIALYEGLFAIEEDYRQYRYLCSFYYRLLALRLVEEIDQEKILTCFQEAYTLWQEQAPEAFLTPKKRKAVCSILRFVAGSSVHALELAGEGVLPQLVAILEEEVKVARPVDFGTQVAWLYHQYLTGQISKKSYLKQLKLKWIKGKARFGDGFTYGCWDFGVLFDNELADEDFDKENLFFMNAGFQFIYYLIPALLKEEPTDEEIAEIWSRIDRYYQGFPHIDGVSMVDLLIERNLMKVLPYSNRVPFAEGEEPTNYLIGNIFVRRQICTAIHALMVSALGECIVEHLSRKNPEALSALAGVPLEDLKKLSREASVAGLCHDTGKLYCSDIINLQTRRIRDAEFALIKEHPACGQRILSASPVLAPYAPIAMSHHKTYDKKGGYPGTAGPLTPKEAFLTDLVTICDSIDAATDGLGRNYANAKTFRTVLDELIAWSGGRYNGALVEMIANDEALIQELEALVGEDRARIQYEIYSLFVDPAAQAKEKKEIYIRPCRKDDLGALCALTDRTRSEQEQILEKAKGFGYLLLDDKDSILGIVFAAPASSACGAAAEGFLSTDALELTQMIVDRSCRRLGYGTKLLAHLCDMAFARGIGEIYMPEVVEGHFDKFGWRNYFYHAAKEGWLVRTLGEE